MKNKTTVILSLAIAVLVCVIITMYTTKPSYTDTQAKAQYQHTIDSLDNVILNYKRDQLELDKKIAGYELDIRRLDFQIDSAENKIIEIRNYYATQIKNIGRFSTTELDDFFSNRYK
jgi:peptidoglycan hydrolase CwlO-like protein